MEPAELATKKGDIAAMRTSTLNPSQYPVSLTSTTVAAGGAAGSLLSAPVSDVAGRQKALLVYGITFLGGAVMQMFANYPVFMAGCFIAGLAVGATSSLTPQYLAEWAPKSIRGSCVSLYNLAIIVALALAFWINYAVERWKYVAGSNDNGQWQMSLGVQLIPGAIFVVLIAFAPESARWMIAHGRRERGLGNLVRIRGLPEEDVYVMTEYGEIVAQVEEEQELRAGEFCQLINLNDEC